MQEGPPKRRIVGLMIGLGTIVVAILCVALLVIRQRGPDMLTFEPSSAARPLHVYVEVVSVDPVRDAMELRLDFATTSDRQGVRYAATADRDIVVMAGDGDSQQEISLQRGKSMTTASVTANLSGGPIDHYPFDRYAATLTLAAFEASGGTRDAAIPLRVTLWKRIAGWEIDASAELGSTEPGGVVVSFEADRPRVQVVVATVLYGAMALMALVALTVSSLLYLGIRRADTTLAAVQATMVFTLPALRNMLPGAPPMGVYGDSLVLFWAEIAVVASLAVTIATWARRGDGR